MLEINKRVFLLKMLKLQKDESVDDAISMLAGTGMFSVQEGKLIYMELKDEGYIVEGSLSVKGVLEAQKALREFKL